jgi:hypothetical protein
MKKFTMHRDRSLNDSAEFYIADFYAEDLSADLRPFIFRPLLPKEQLEFQL